jgi:hypothetical protein
MEFFCNIDETETCASFVDLVKDFFLLPLAVVVILLLAAVVPLFFAMAAVKGIERRARRVDVL